MNLFSCPAEKRVPRLVVLGKVSGSSGKSAVVSPSRMIAQADGSHFGKVATVFFFLGVALMVSMALILLVMIL